MNISYVIKCVKVMQELTDEEKEEVLTFINDNIDDIDVDSNFVEGGPFSTDYYDVHVEGPEQFTMHFSVGAITDYLKLWELSDEFTLNTFNCKTYDDEEEN